MDKHDNMKKNYILLVKSGLILVWYYAVSLIVSLAIHSKINDATAYRQYVDQNENKLMVVIYLMLFFGIWAFDTHKEQFISYFREWKISSVIKYILWGIGAYIVCNIVTSLLLPIFPDYEEIGSMFKHGQIFLSFIGTVILPPIIEEYLFRHKIQGYLKQVFNVPLAIIIQAVLFGGLHSYMIQKIYAVLIGLFFGYIDEKEGTVKCSIVMHMTVNCIGWVIGCFLI